MKLRYFIQDNVSDLLVEVMCFLPFMDPGTSGSIQRISLEKGVECSLSRGNYNEMNSIVGARDERRWQAQIFFC